ncbi:hypothetical protein QPK14_13180 [Photorhabdus temperata subsp. temperata]|nr:hypothetical protein [Photorhabdus temperata]
MRKRTGHSGALITVAKYVTIVVGILGRGTDPANRQCLGSVRRV